MPIDKLTISNFKGIAEKTEFEIRPLTLFIGPNSSGKSSCIHALAALAQTVKLASSKLPIVLDDEFAQVHLGRFIEVIHSKSYDDNIEIGVSLNKPGVKVEYEENREVINSVDDIQVLYSFKSTKRTQDISMERAEFNVGKKNLTFTKSANDYSISFNSKTLNPTAKHRSGLKLSFAPTLSRKMESKDIESENEQRNLFDAFVLNETIADIILGELRKTLYLGPFRQAPQRRYQTRGSSPLEVGAQGESSVTLLANEYVQTKAKS